MKFNLFISSIVYYYFNNINNNEVNAACGNNANLCFQDTKYLDVINNAPQKVTISSDQCCSADSIKENSCPSTPISTCRETRLKAPFTNDISSFCTNMTLTFKWKEDSEQCCSTCACFGDPHCSSFNGIYDSWVLCDGRTKNENAVLGSENPCPIKKPACEAQLDHMGKSCVYKSNILPPISDNGSPCRSTSAEPALITMYEFNNFKFVITLGERGVITNVQITDGSNFYFLDAEVCTKQQEGGPTPWRDAINANDPPVDPEWLGKKFISEKTEGGRLWKISGFASDIEATIKCTRLSKKGDSRINVENLFEPNRQRAGTAGFCVQDSIDKMKSSHQHTDDVKDFCWKAFSTQDAILTFCGDSYFTQITKCKAKFCSAYNDPQKCLQTLAKTDDGWPRFYCAMQTLPPPFDPAQCNSGVCKQCIYDIYDFGWAEAIANWQNHNGNNGGNGGEVPSSCTKWEDLKESLDKCESGVTIQYLDLDSLDYSGVNLNCWKNFVAIPYGTNICEDKIVVSSTDNKYKPLFKSQLRLMQCDNSALCGVTNTCTPVHGYDASIEVSVPDATNLVMKYWQLVREGTLVCAKGHPDCLKQAYSSDLEKVKCTSCLNCFNN